MSIQWIRRTLVIAGTAAAAGACAAGGGGGGGSAADAMSTAVVTVENRNWSDINVRVARDGTTSQKRLGTVTSMTEERFTLPRWLLAGASAIRLIADPIGSTDAFVTEPIQVSADQTITWTVEANLDLSSWTIR